jgi:glycerol-3-phosphate acyltransferase PlsX
MRIVLDASGGDNAPQETVKGAVQAARAYGYTVVLVGQQERIRAELTRHQTSGLDLPIVDAPETVDMEEVPTQAVRRKAHSSHMVGLRLVQAGEADAFVSAGHSGASIAGSFLVLGRMPGVERAVMAAFLPRLSGPPALLLDVGATTDCKPEYLLQFAQMGSIYAERVQGIPRPRVALLSNGEEESKGNRLVQEAAGLLRESDVHFVGNTEPKDFLVHDVCDVVIADGFTGNLMLKMGEATVALLLRKLAAEMRRAPTLRTLLALAPVVGLALLPGQGRWRALAGALAGSAGLLSVGIFPLWQLYRATDYRSYGGVPLLGIKGVVVIAHGRSDALAISNAIHRAGETVEAHLQSAIAEALSTSQAIESHANGRS